MTGEDLGSTVERVKLVDGDGVMTALGQIGGVDVSSSATGLRASQSNDQG